MEKYFVTYNQSLALKELGFDEPCISWYTVFGKFSNDYSNPKKYNSEYELGSFISAPLKSQVFEWARREYGLYHVVHHFEHKKNTTEEFLSEVSGKLLMGNDDISGFSYHSTYEEAESACIDKLIEIVKNK